MADTTKADALRKLLEAVDGGDREEELMGLIEAAPWRINLNCVLEAYWGSLDAAKALHEAVLPGWQWNVWESAVCNISQKTGPRNDQYGSSDNPARAWLIAILKALIAEAGND